MSKKEPPAFTITVDLNVYCKGCGKRGATESGHCLRCVGKAMVKEARARRGKARKGTDG